MGVLLLPRHPLCYRACRDSKKTKISSPRVQCVLSVLLFHYFMTKAPAGNSVSRY